MKIQRAWGWYLTLFRTPWFCVKILRFKPEGALSMQKHKHRTEIWFLMNAMGILADDVEKTWVNKFWGFVRIKPNTWHKFTAFHNPVYAIELQYGRKVTESDIERK